MSNAYCDVCKKNGTPPKPYFCDLCQWSFSLCDACKNRGYFYWEKPKRRTAYCPQCNEKPEWIKKKMDAATSLC